MKMLSVFWDTGTRLNLALAREDVVDKYEGDGAACAVKLLAVVVSKA